MADQNAETVGLRRLFCRAATSCGICIAVSALTIPLLLTVLFCVFRVPIGVAPISVGGSIAFVFEKGFVPILVVVGEMLKSLSPWGLIALIAMCLILWGPNWIRETLSSSKLELPGGLKFEGAGISASFRKELSAAERIVDRANKELAEAYSSAYTFASQLRDRCGIPSLVGPLAVEMVRLIGDRCPSDFRLTLYVPDFVFSDRLYQFTEYYDRAGQSIPDAKAGRTFSIRYGIIGRVWRSGEPEIEGQLISPSEMEQLPPNHSDADLERFIARRWGLSWNEAIHIKRYNSYGAIRLQRADKNVGLLYFDSKEKDAFCESGRSKELETKISEMLMGTPLLLKLLEISNEVAPWSGRIQIIRNSNATVL